METNTDKLLESNCKVSIFKLVNGEIIISIVDGNYLVVPCAIIQVSQEGRLGFNPYGVFSQSFERIPMFKDIHIISTYDAEEELAKHYKIAMTEFLQKMRANRAGIVLDTNVAQAKNVSAFRPVRK